MHQFFARLFYSLLSQPNKHADYQPTECIPGVLLLARLAGHSSARAKASDRLQQVMTSH